MALPPWSAPYLGRRVGSRLQSAVPDCYTVPRECGKPPQSWPFHTELLAAFEHTPLTHTLRASSPLCSRSLPPPGSPPRTPPFQYVILKEAFYIPRTESLVPLPKNSFSLVAQRESPAGKVTTCCFHSCLPSPPAGPPLPFPRRFLTLGSGQLDNNAT